MFLLPANLVHDVSEGVYSYEVSAGEKGLVGDSVFVFGAAMMAHPLVMDWLRAALAERDDKWILCPKPKSSALTIRRR
jgi:hypothetical protein